MNHMKRSFKFVTLVISILAVFCLTQCDTRQNIDREAVKKEMLSREIKRVKESDILLEGERIGKLISESSDSLAQATVDKYQISYDSILWDSSPADSLLNTILDAYQFANESGYELPQGIQSQTDKTLYYCVPMEQSDSISGVVVLSIPRKDLVLHFEVK